MQKDTGCVMARRIETVDLTIQHVLQEVDGKPLRHNVGRCNRPRNRSKIKSFLNVDVIRNVPVVIVIDKIEGEHPGVNRQARHKQQQTN